MFKFNFGSEEEAVQEDFTSGAFGSLLPSEEIFITKDVAIPVNLEPLQLADDFSILKGRAIPGTEVAAAFEDSALAESDLVPGKYEGGFKLWEGGIDLSTYLAQTVIGRNGLLSQARVLELGCGQGLPGIVALLKGATVDFQDYNKEVIEMLTIPTVMANWRHNSDKSSSGMGSPVLHSVDPPVRFFSGDWGTLGCLLENIGLRNGYDIILTTETIYTLEGMKRLFSCIKQCLKRPHGVCYVSAKSFYFGVGGGVAAFLDLVASDECMTSERALRLDDGMSNRREILILKWKEVKEGM